MKRAMTAVAAVCVLAVTAAGAAAQGTKYGEGVKLTSSTTVAAVTANPKAFLGKTIRVDGVVTAVCDMAGCWMELRDENADATTAKTLRMKVDDGVIVFPKDAVGKKASAEGVFEMVSAAAAAEHAEHAHADAKPAAKPAEHAHAEAAKPAAKPVEHAHAEAAKPSAQQAAALPKYQVKATGAVVY
ncbi:MAG: DUF4920 domain-containing protein [Acidobacteria bacterium]|nr:MAG: DUF4920 domain-containing protein [Acidobacteriota bacterium]RPJ75698.1 MAG: DUF4920 domain-containing protein [Acidobacteriota bacterium]